MRADEQRARRQVIQRMEERKLLAEMASGIEAATAVETGLNSSSSGSNSLPEWPVPATAMRPAISDSGVDVAVATRWTSDDATSFLQTVRADGPVRNPVDVDGAEAAPLHRSTPVPVRTGSDSDERNETPSWVLRLREKRQQQQDASMASQSEGSGSTMVRSVASAAHSPASELDVAAQSVIREDASATSGEHRSAAANPDPSDGDHSGFFAALRKTASVVTALSHSTLKGLSNADTPPGPTASQSAEEAFPAWTSMVSSRLAASPPSVSATAAPVPTTLQPQKGFARKAHRTSTGGSSPLHEPEDSNEGLAPAISYGAMTFEGMAGPVRPAVRGAGLRDPFPFIADHPATKSFFMRSVLKGVPTRHGVPSPLNTMAAVSTVPDARRSGIVAPPAHTSGADAPTVATFIHAGKKPDG